MAAPIYTTVDPSIWGGSGHSQQGIGYPINANTVSGIANGEITPANILMGGLQEVPVTQQVTDATSSQAGLVDKLPSQIMNNVGLNQGMVNPQNMDRTNAALGMDNNDPLQQALGQRNQRNAENSVGTLTREAQLGMPDH